MGVGGPCTSQTVPGIYHRHSAVRDNISRRTNLEWYISCRLDPGDALSLMGTGQREEGGGGGGRGERNMAIEHGGAECLQAAPSWAVSDCLFFFFFFSLTRGVTTAPNSRVRQRSRPRRQIIWRDGWLEAV
jgi:hypothetical protein